jgi:hypothetical protein
MKNDEFDDPDIIPPNDTLAALMRKLEDGAFSNYSGGEVQRLLAKLRQIAAKRGGNAVGEVTIKIKIPMGKDGYGLPVASIKCKAPEIAREESMIFVDQDGDLMARPVEKQLSLKVATSAQDTKEPAAPAAKGM